MTKPLSGRRKTRWTAGSWKPSGRRKRLRSPEKKNFIAEYFMRKISFCDALNEAMSQEMERDPSVFVYGIGVPDHKNIFGSTAGLTT